MKSKKKERHRVNHPLRCIGEVKNRDYKKNTPSGLTTQAHIRKTKFRSCQQSLELYKKSLSSSGQEARKGKRVHLRFSAHDALAFWTIHVMHHSYGDNNTLACARRAETLAKAIRYRLPINQTFNVI